MKKIFYSTIIAALVFPVAWGSSSQMEVLFCTKNLEDPSFSPSLSAPPIAAGHSHREQLDAYDVLNHGQHGSAVDFRHGFMAMAAVDKKRDGVVTLSELQTQGFGQIPNPRPDQRTGSIYQEWWNGDELDYMAAAAGHQDFSPTDYNCCTAAYGAINHVGGDMSTIDPTCFNLLGIGIVWKGSDLTTAEGLSNKVSVWTGMSYDFSSRKTPKDKDSDGKKSEL